MIQAEIESGVLMQEVRDVADYWLGMKAKGMFDDEDDALSAEENYAKEIVYLVRRWLLKRCDGEIDDKTLKEFVGILLDQRL